MRLRVITEFRKNTTEHILSTLEDMVDSCQGKFDYAGQRKLYSYLAQFTQPALKQVAALLGTDQTTPETIAQQIVNGELIRYVDGHSIPKMPDNEPLNLDMEPTEAELRSIESDNYVNEPPAFPVRPGDTPDPTTLDPAVAKRFRAVSAASLIDDGDAQLSQPFFYLTAANRLFVGRTHSFHENILNNVPQSISNHLYGIYDGKTDGVMGRMGYDLSRIDQRLATATVIAIYIKDKTTPQSIAAAIKSTVTEGYAPPDALVVAGGKLSSASQVANSGAQINDDDRRKGELQVAMHLGRWPNGQPLTFADRKRIKQQLGMDLRPTGIKHPIQRAGEQAGIIHPGQKWWAPHSEERRRGCSLSDVTNLNTR